MIEMDEMKKAQMKTIVRSNIYQLYKQKKENLFDILLKYKMDITGGGFLTAAEFIECHDNALAAYYKDLK